MKPYHFFKKYLLLPCFLIFAVALHISFHHEISVSNTVNGRELPIYCVQTDKPQIAISFDAAWGNDDTRRILEILKKNDVKATFFMTGGWVESYPDDVKAIYADGHDLGTVRITKICHSCQMKNASRSFYPSMRK